MDFSVKEMTTYVNIPTEEGLSGTEGKMLEMQEALRPNDESHACLLDLVDEDEEAGGCDNDKKKMEVGDEESRDLSLSDSDEGLEKGEKKHPPPPNNDSYGHIIAQIVLPFALAGLGAVFAGLLLQKFVTVRKSFRSMLAGSVPKSFDKIKLDFPKAEKYEHKRLSYGFFSPFSFFLFFSRCMYVC
jgi:hypothetical protein